jgi:Ran-binding protein 3
MTSSGFGGVSGTGLKDFSSNGSSGILGLKEKPAKPFGAPEDETEESGDESSGDDANGEDGKEGKKDDVDVEKRFHHQEGMRFVSCAVILSGPQISFVSAYAFTNAFPVAAVETGEEGETTIFSCRAKLFYFDKQEKAWKERGIGLFKLNATATETENDYDRWSRSSDDSEGEVANNSTSKNVENKRKARLLMRADGVFRVILNVPVFKGMKVGDEKGNSPTGRMVSFTALEDGKAVPLLVKVHISESKERWGVGLVCADGLQTSSPANAKELCKHISEIQQEL